jgi:hypothetical protein
MSANVEVPNPARHFAARGVDVRQDAAEHEAMGPGVPPSRI